MTGEPGRRGRVYHPRRSLPAPATVRPSMLFFMYDLTGDPKYLVPVRKYIEAEKRMATKIRVDGREIQVRGNPAGLPERPPYRGGRQNVEDYFLDTPDEEPPSENGSNPVEGHGTYSEDKFPWYPSFFRTPEWPTCRSHSRIGAAESGLDLSSSPMPFLRNRSRA